MDTAADCPDADTLERFLLGRLTGPPADALDEHISACAACAARLDVTPAEDGLVALLRRRSAVLGSVDATQIDRVVDRLRPAAEELASFGPYRVGGEIGRGGMGVVYLAEDARLGRPVALKLIRDGSLAATRDRYRFVREATALARLSHPNILQIYEVGEHDGRPYLALEFVPGGTLAERLGGRPQPPVAAATLAATLADAVRFAHDHGVTHRDLKPTNVLLGGRGAEVHTVKVADFGLARRTDDDGLTRTGDLLGTPGYMAPEATRGDRNGIAADVYALGAILYEMLTGRPPFRGATVADTLEQVRALDPVSVRRLQPKVPRDLETICLTCLAKEPRRRYASASALAADLRRFLEGKPILARRSGWPERAAKWARRQPAGAALIVVSAAALVALIAVAIEYEGRLRRERRAAETAANDARRLREHARADYRSAREALEKMLARVRDSRRGDLPGVRDLSREQQEDALGFYLAVAGRNDDPDLEVRWDAARAGVEAGHLQLQLGRREQAQETLRAAERALVALTADRPDDLRFRREHALALSHRGLISGATEGRALLESALRETEALIAADPANDAYRNDLARICHGLGDKAILSDDTAAAERYYTQAIETRRAVLARHPDWRPERLALAQTQANLILVRQRSVRMTELEPLVSQVTAELEHLSATDPNEPDAPVALATVRLNWAYVQANNGRAADSLVGLDRSIDSLEEFLKREPQWSTVRSAVYHARGTRAIMLDKIGRVGDAVLDYPRIVELSPTADARIRHRIEWAALLVAAGDLSGAAAKAEAAAADPAPAPNAGLLRMFVGTCATIARAGLFRARPYHDASVRSAAAMLTRTRRELSPEMWAEWIAPLRSDSGLAGLLAEPAVESAIR